MAGTYPSEPPGCVLAWPPGPQGRQRPGPRPCWGLRAPPWPAWPLGRREGRDGRGLGHSAHGAAEPRPGHLGRLGRGGGGGLGCGTPFGASSGLRPGPLDRLGLRGLDWAGGGGRCGTRGLPGPPAGQGHVKEVLAHPAELEVLGVDLQAGGEGVAAAAAVDRGVGLVEPAAEVAEVAHGVGGPLHVHADDFAALGRLDDQEDRRVVGLAPVEQVPAVVGHLRVDGQGADLQPLLLADAAHPREALLRVLALRRPGGPALGEASGQVLQELVDHGQGAVPRGAAEAAEGLSIVRPLRRDHVLPDVLLPKQGHLPVQLWHPVDQQLPHLQHYEAACAVEVV
mmetsp:Transcript_100389/g.312250  ORF Transcript_100389/g.312250 Transcript_100389/m.312250 type:complete len:340 (+) Transcript_100389:2-1021(+)